MHRLVLFVLLFIPCITPILLSSSASAINSSITLNLSSSTLSLDLTPKLGGGFAKSGNNTINVKTNHYTGYTLKITAGTNDTNSTKLVNIESNTTIDSIESNVSEADFSANTDAASSYNGKWGFMPSQYVTTDNTNPSSPVHTIVDNDPTGSNASNAVYLPAPDYATGTTLDITNSANPDTFNTYTISLGARAGMETTAGTYSNTFNILAIGNPIIYSITFSDNTGDSSVTNLPTGTGSVSTSDIDILLPTTIPTRTGYDFIGWCKTETTTNGTVCLSNTPYPASQPAAGQTPAVPSYYEIDQTTDNTELTFYATWAPKTYTLNLDVNGGTSGSGSTTATATYDATTLSTITNPTRANGTATRTVSGFTKSTSASDATISSTTTLNSNATITYTFNGWRETSAANSTLIATNATTPVLQANTTYTNSTGAWNYDNSSLATTLYAGWDSTIGSYSSVTLPTITKTGYNCHWNTNSSDTGTSYNSGASIVPNTNLTITAFCTPKTYELTLNANGGTLGSTKTTATYDSATLSTITNPTKANDTGTRTISGLAANGTNASGATITFQSTGNCIAANNCKSTNTTTYAFNGWYKETGQTNKIASNATTPVLQANTSYTNASGAWTNDGTVTLYAGWTADVGSYAQVTLPTITKTGYTCGWDTSSTATNPTYSSGSSMTPGGNITLYGICKANTYTINLDGNNATTSGSTSTTATYDSTTLSSITNPSRQYTVSGFDSINNGASGATITYQSTGNCTSSSNCKSTYTFNGWYKESGATNKIASNATTPVLETSTSYTDASGKWTSTSTQTLYAGWSSQAIILPTITKPGHTCGWTETSSGATTITYQSGSSLTPARNYTLHGVCTANTYTITLNNNGGTGGSGSTSVTYGATTLSTITNPTKANTTGTRTISGFTMTTAGTNASVTYPSSGCTSASNCKSTNTTTYTFNGWYKESGTTNKIASNATTPVLQANTSYTDANGKWTSTSAQTLYAGWTASVGGYSSVTLPSITRTGSTCGWATSSTATSWTYASGASLVPDGNITLYGVCKNNITLDRNGGTGGSDSATATYGTTTLTNITNPTKASTTGTRTISGLAANGTNASGATVTFQSSGNCTSTSNCKSSNTTTYTFNGWHQGSATGTVVTNGGSPANLQPSTNYTNATSQWTYTTASAVTLYAGWNSSAGSYASVTLPTITKTGHTCGWDTSSTATNPTYASGASMTPGGSITLYGICSPNTYKVTLSNQSATSAGTTEAYYQYNTTKVINNVTCYYYTTAALTTCLSGGYTITKPTKDGYTFNGYYTSTSGGGTQYVNAGGLFTNNIYQTVGDRTLYAYWTPNTYKVTLNNQSADTAGTTEAYYQYNTTKVINNVTCYYYTTSALSTCLSGGYTITKPTKTGHTFGGYYTGTNGTGTQYVNADGTFVNNIYQTIGDKALYAKWTANTYSLTINFAGTGVSSVQVRTASGTGGTLMGTVSTSGGSVSNLVYNTAYYLYPVFSSGYEFSSWAKTSGSGTLSSTTASNPTFTIGAGNGVVTVTGKQSCTQISGYMQDFTGTGTYCSNTGTLTDKRDNQTYTVAKLADGKWWMTENLNLAGGTALSATDTDVTSAYISSFSTSNNLTKSGNTIVLPASSTSGFDTANYSYVYNSGNKSSNCASPGCYSYYSWDAATLGSGRTIATDNTDAEQSICPKGWKLPTTRYTTATNWQSADFYAMAHQYGLDSTTDTSEFDDGFYTQAGPGTTPNFLLAGLYYNGSFYNGGSRGYYWSSTSLSSTSYARSLGFNSSYVFSANDGSRYNGFSVRCLFSGQ